MAAATALLVMGELTKIWLVPSFAKNVPEVRLALSLARPLPQTVSDVHPELRAKKGRQAVNRDSEKMWCNYRNTYVKVVRVVISFVVG